MRALPPMITSRTNAKVKALRASLSGEARRPGDLLGLEGEHLVEEAHLAGMSFETVYLREGSRPKLIERLGVELRSKSWAVLSAEVFDSAVSTSTPQGLAATWVIQPAVPVAASSVLVLEAIQDPGNLGTLLRSAAAFNFCRVMVTLDTVNSWNPKVVRAAAGSVFRVEVSRLSLEEIGARLREEGVRLFAGVAQPQRGADTEALAEANLPPRCAVMVGNEGAGLSAAALAMADEHVTLPTGNTESLNAAVAGSVLMYEVRCQRPLRTWVRQQGGRL